MGFIKGIAQIAAILLAGWFTLQLIGNHGTSNVGEIWHIFMFHLAQFTFFVGTVLIMIAGLIMASSVIFGAGAVRFSITVLALGILMIVVTALEGNQSCATPYSSRDACDKEFARLSQAKADEDWGSVLSKKFIIKAFESGVESVIGRK